jgi:hypothetical protein
VRFELREPGSAAIHRHDVEARIAEDGLEREPHGRFVVDDKDAGHVEGA